jgi:uncharacterized membrane protein
VAFVETSPGQLSVPGARAERTTAFTVSPTLSVRLAVVGYAIVGSAAAVADYVGFRSARFDLGNAVQAIWSTRHGRFLETTSLSGSQLSRLGSHVDLLLVLFTPAWLIWSSPVLLLVVQVAAVGAGALPVFWLGRKHLGSETAARHFAFAYLLYPATQWNALDPNLGFHAVSLALPLLLYALWWLDEERWALFFVAAVLAAATKEEIPLVVGCLGIWYGVSRKRPAVGAAIFGVGAAVTVVDFLYVIPHFSPSGVSPFAGRYASLGSTPTRILETAVSHPIKVAEIVLTTHKLAYLGLLVIPLLGLCFRAPLLLVAALPTLAINLLSSSPDQTSVKSHYAAATAAVVFGATILGAARTPLEARRLSLIILAAVTVTAVISPLWTAVPVAREAITGSAFVRAQRHAVGLIPDSEPVSASNALGAHLSARRRILLFPVVRGANWIAVDTADTEGASSFRPVIRQLRQERRFTLVYESNGVVVMRRNDVVARADRH